MDMSLVNLASGVAQNSNMTQIGTAMLAKTLDAQRSEGAQMLKLMDSAAMELAVNPHIGGNFDMSV